MNEAPRSAVALGELAAEHITAGYPARTVIEDLSLTIPTGKFTVIIGPNACGKSTLLRTLGRMIRASAGTVILDGKGIHHYRSKEVARRIGLLPQSSSTPAAVTVADLVARGRYPHQKILNQWSHDDDDAVRSALTEVGMLEHAATPVEELSGGQRQRVWIGMALAQQTPTLLLDEPTTFLDIAHQLDVLDLCAHLVKTGRTVVAVLHDLNTAARYADHIIAMKDGAIVAQGSPAEVVTPAVLRTVFNLAAVVVTDPEAGTPLVIPRIRQVSRTNAPPANSTPAGSDAVIVGQSEVTVP